MIPSIILSIKKILKFINSPTVKKMISKYIDLMKKRGQKALNIIFIFGKLRFEIHICI
jgi:hypothetical protein